MKSLTTLNIWKLRHVTACHTVMVGAFAFCTGAAMAGPAPLVSAPLALWSGDAPGEKGDSEGEKLIEREDGLVRLTNVTKPTITFYRPGKGIKNTGAAVLVCPGGGYTILAMSHEGTEVCEWLSGMGVTAVLLKYRVPRREGLDIHHAPLQDAQRAMSLVRQRAGEWGIDPQRIGVLGFSAGGHLAAMLMSQYGQARSYPLDPEVDAVSCRPDFAVLVYPAYLQDKDNPDRLAPGMVPTQGMPPVFLVAAHNDKTYVEGSALLYIALKRASIPAELHIFASGGHGFGMKKSAGRVAEWAQICGQWMREMGMLGN